MISDRIARYVDVVWRPFPKVVLVSCRTSIRIAVVNDGGSPHVRRVNTIRSETAMFTCPEALQRIRIVCSHGLRRNIGGGGCPASSDWSGPSDARIVVQAAPHCRPRSARRPACKPALVLVPHSDVRIPRVRGVCRKNHVGRVAWLREVGPGRKS